MKKISPIKRKKSQSRSIHVGTAINYSMTTQSSKIIDIFAPHIATILIIRLTARHACLMAARKLSSKLRGSIWLLNGFVLMLMQVMIRMLKSFKNLLKRKIKIKIFESFFPTQKYKGQFHKFPSVVHSKIKN